MNEIKAKYGGSSDIFREVCGLPINTYFSAVKMRWLLQNSVEVSSNTDDLVFGTIDTWLIAKLTGLSTFATDSSNASRTMLMDINTLEWSEKMLEAFEIKKQWLPTIVKSSSDNYGLIAGIGALDGVPITGVLGD